jgi:hypothetical protein
MSTMWWGRENMKHFLLKCTILQAVRYIVLDDIDTEFNIITGKMFYYLDSYLKIQILLDCSVLLNYDNHVCKDKLLLKQLTQLDIHLSLIRYCLILKIKCIIYSITKKILNSKMTHILYHLKVLTSKI